MGESVNKKIYELMPEEVLALFDTKKSGLPQREATIRLERYGANVLGSVPHRSKIKVFLDNFKSPLIYTLLVAATITLFLGKFLDSVVIVLITLINACIGYYQQRKTDNALETLRKMTILRSSVYRDGKRVELKSDVLVPGDVVILEEGDKIPADGRLIESSSLLINEAVLTGESLPVKKNSEPFITVDTSEEPGNLLFMGTTVLGGRGLMVVTSTGIDTEFGKISKLVEDEIGSLTPLQKKLQKFNGRLGPSIVAICLVVFVLGVITGKDVITMFELAISMAVSAIPEGLPVAITVILVLGVKRMAKRKAILRNLTAVETLGTTTVIASDKTGTITHNKLTVTKLFTDRVLRLSGEGYGAQGDLYEDDLRVSPDEHIKQLLRVGAITNNGKMVVRNKRTDVFGDPTDCAILVAAYKLGINEEGLRRYVVKIDEIPFSSEKKYHAVLAESSGSRATYVKGAPEVIFDLCSHNYKGEAKPKKINQKIREDLENQVKYFASRGLRTIALAFREERVTKTKLRDEDVEKGKFVLVGLMGMRDTYRSGVKEAINKCKEAGIRMIMITGDHLDTARAIGQDIGIIENEDEAIESQSLEDQTPRQIRDIVKRVNVFARINPTAKFKIIEALKANGEIVAMTGDGVNDVPALKKADIGVAMGVMGTEAAKDASDMVLTNDNFSTIVDAISEGRAVFSNIRKTIFYLLSTNLGEVLTVFTGLLFGYPLVLLPLQILWINLVTDSCTAIPLGMEPPHTSQLQRPPRDPGEPILTRRMVIKILLTALVMGIGSIAIFSHFYKDDLIHARSLVFTFLVVVQWLNVVNARSETSSIFTVKPFSNKPLIWGITVAVILQMLLIYTPFLDGLFEVVPLSLQDWMIVVPMALVTVVVSEAEKFFYRFYQRKKKI